MRSVILLISRYVTLCCVQAVERKTKDSRKKHDSG